MPSLNKENMCVLMERLWPLNRSIMGNAVRKSLDIISDYMPLNFKEIPTRTKCFDWMVPNEWNISNRKFRDSFLNSLDEKHQIHSLTSNRESYHGKSIG